MSRAFWAGKRVLITGHTGFKGSWLSLWLARLGAEIAGYSLGPVTEPSLFELARIGKDAKSFLGDVRDLKGLTAAIRSHKPEIVFHLAAQSLVRLSYEDPVGTYSANVIGTVHLLESVRNCPGVRVVLVVTSDKCYESLESVQGYREGDPLGGYDPYSSSKGCAELVTSAYRRSFFNPGDYDAHGVALASVRAGNIIGGGDWAKDRLVPDVVTAFMEGRRASIRNPRSVRPWQHVLDPLHGYLVLAERLWSAGPQFSEAWNFGPGDGQVRPVDWVADRLSELWGHGSGWDTSATANQAHESAQLRLDCSKARSRLSWSPKLPLEAALQWTIEWYRSFRDGNDMRELTRSQIERYAQLPQR